ncbi:MAG: class I SAM-dependent methyltransferase [Bacteroidota bacterium]
MVDLQDQHEYWDRVANDKTFTHPIDLQLLQRYVDNDACILDYGCGYGRVVQLLADAGFTNAIGYDTSERLIARGRASGVSNIFHTTGELPIAGNSVDCCLLFAVLTCIPANSSQREVIESLHAKLKPGGILYVSDYYLQTVSDEVGSYSYLDDDPGNYGVFTLPEGATFRHHTHDWIRSLLQEFTMLEESAIVVQTMNGHKANGFQLVAQK